MEPVLVALKGWGDAHIELFARPGGVGAAAA